MRKGLVTMGVLILFIGLVSLTISNIQEKEFSKTSLRVENKWSAQDSFQKGENLTLRFFPHRDWSLPQYPELGGPPYSKFLMVNITNVDTYSYTLIKVTLVPPSDSIPPEPPYAFLLLPYGIEVVHHGAIIIEDYPDEINGIAKSSGRYRVRCSLMPDSVIDRDAEGNPWSHPASPPTELTLGRVTTEMKKRYTSLLPVGATLSVIGLIVSIWGAEAEEPKLARKRRGR